MRPNPCLFVVGCPRSGTTLLQRMLDNHPDLAVANDTHFIPRALEKAMPQVLESAASGTEILLTPDLLHAVRSYRRFPRLGLDEEAVARCAERSATYQELVSALYLEFAGLRGKALGGEKTPDYVRRLPLLGGLFPESKFIHLVRDGRDVALSLLDWAEDAKGPGKLKRWREDPVAMAALWWRWQVSMGQEDGNALGPRYIEIAYEELVERPEATLRRITRFLDLPYSAAMSDFHRGKTRPAKGASAKSAWLPPTMGLRDWRSQMSSDDVEVFEVVAGGLLEGLGYERTFCVPSDDAIHRAERSEIWWHEHLAGRMEKVRRRAQAQSGL